MTKDQAIKHAQKLSKANKQTYYVIDDETPGVYAVWSASLAEDCLTPSELDRVIVCDYRL